MEIEVVKENGEILKQVVELGTKNSKTLGHFPEGAYVDHARKGFLICAHQERILLGYILFSITSSKSYVRIIQLCIADEARGTGVAKELLNSLKNKFRFSLKGIALSCRCDYIEATSLWEKYGFKAMDKVRSRSLKENYLFKWWYDFGNHDLFSLSHSNSSKQKALLDANILIKLRNDRKDEISGTNFLLDDWLISEIDFFYAPEIYNEIKRDKNDQRARETRAFLSNFYEAKFDPDLRDIILEKLHPIISGSSENDLSDKRQLAECIAGEINYFVTTDEKILVADSEVNKLFGIQILRPIDIILRIDEDNNKSNYQSTRIAGVNYENGFLKSGEIDDLVDTLFDKNNSEKKHELRSIFTLASVNIKDCRTRVIRDNNRVILGVWISELSPDRLLIPLLRTTKSKLSSTLFKQIVSELINYAVIKKRNLIVIYDGFIATNDQETLENMGFLLKDGEWSKLAIRAIIRSSQLFDFGYVSDHYDEKSIKRRLSDISNSDEFLISLERKLWPLKFSDVDIPTYIIPIKPFWASQLFDYYAANDSIFGAKASVVWNRENVYYRNVKPVSEKNPSRILWYSSSSSDKYSIRTSSIVACSYLDESQIGEAKELFRLFKHYGIYEWKNIFQLAKHSPKTIIKALKFSDTEVFKYAVPFSQVNDILFTNGRKRNSFTGPLEVSNQIFLEIYKLGVNHK
ncbi:acetyltransferase (GNAT) family protein [Algoriphagus chordae]|uniref:Acetyltransferase (GNAT) family protein n=2 Tax=Algoriphagus chordae TaxID=237019 RepID=A0A2W7RP78_9BACT|nr:acetyltransferase (GNAT) family protein [Algoriphagus chordae]